ncbi:MAG: hypothetical protein EOM15_06850 [Spirochaetia bacterium]|nr:hypothetical protein [Spirochaetia bacterium]
MLSSILFAISCLPISTMEKYVLARENPSLQDLKKMRGFSQKRIEKMLKFITRSNCKVCFYGMQEYPQAFFDLENPPFRLMYNKSLPTEGQRLVTISGTREPYQQAALAAYTFSLEAVANGATLVCSNSRGIDRSVLHACHDYKTEAFVLCDCGLGTERIAKNALVSSMSMISAYEPEDEAVAYRCLSRNVLSVALSKATVIMQAPKKSGALHVACSALDQGKDVFVHASANQETERYQGSASLVEMGASVVEDYAALAMHLDFPCINTVLKSCSYTSLYRFGSAWYSIKYGQ